MSVPALRTSCQCSAFIAPAVPIGMKAGVRTTPCAVVRTPVRAPPSVARRRKPVGSTIVFLVVDRRARGLFIERLPIADATPKKLRPGRHGDQWLGLLGQQIPQVGVMPTEFVA